VAKFLLEEERSGLVATTRASVGDLVLVVADEYRLTCSVLGSLRLELGGRPVSEGPYE
jgi:aspartyl-tRNA synthetase